MRIGKRIARNKSLLLMAAPALVQRLIFAYIPMVGLILAFRSFSYQHPVLGVGSLTMNYFKLFFVKNSGAWPIIRNTLLLNFYQLLFGFPASIVLALLFVEVKMRWYKNLAQTASFIPNFVSTVAVAGMLRLFLDPTSGFVNKIIGDFGGKAIDFLALPQWFRPVFVTSGIWQTVGWGSVIYLATISAIDKELYEAAIIDGAGRWQQMWHITLPGIQAVIVVLFIFQVGTMMYSNVEKVLLLYNPLTYSTADVIGTYIYRVGLLGGGTNPSFFSIGTAVGFFNSLVGLLLMIIANSLGKRLTGTGIW